MTERESYLKFPFVALDFNINSSEVTKLCICVNIIVIYAHIYSR
jgi:hypothetical protein